MKKVDIDGLLALTPDQIEIVFRHCRGEKNKNIAKLIGIPESSFYVYMRPVYNLLGVTGWDDIDEEFCIRLVKIIQSPEALKRGWPEAFREKIEALKEPVEPQEQPQPITEQSPNSSSAEAEPLTPPQSETEETATTPSSQIPQSQPSVEAEHKLPERRPRWPYIAVPLLILCLLCVSGFLFVLPRFVSMFQTAIVPDQATRTLTPHSLTETLIPQTRSTSTVVASQTSLPTSTSTALATLTFSPTRTSTLTITPTQPSPESTIVSANPSGDWAVRIYRTDDANIFLVNNHIVGGMTWGQKPLDWTGINNLLQNDVSNYVTAVNVGYGSNAFWGFSLSHNDVIVWGNEGDTSCTGLCYTQTVQISPDDTVTEVNLRDFNKKPLSGPWSAKLLAADYGVMMVNGVAVAGSHKMADLGWYDLSGLLYEGQDNIITLAIWNDNGDYSWDAALRRGETVIWGSNNQGSGQVGEVFFTTVIVDGAGNVVR